MLSDELAVLPLALVHSSTLIDQLAVARPLPVKPVADVVVPVGVDEPAISIIDVVLELALVDDVVDLLAYAGHFPVGTQLSDDVLVVGGLSKLFPLVDGFLRIFDNIFKPQWTELIPFVLRCLQRYTVRVLRFQVVGVVFGDLDGPGWR